MSWRYTARELADIVDAKVPAHDAMVSGVSTDTRQIREGDAFFALRGDRFDGSTFIAEAAQKGAAVAISAAATDASAGIPILKVDDPLGALQALAAFHRRQYQPRVIAITGSCGKTSSKDFTAALLGTRYNIVKTHGNLNNEIGCPLSLMQINSDTDMAVIEMGANHVGEIAALCGLAAPLESAITLVAPSHLEGFGSIENIAAAKGEIVEALPRDGRFYVNVDNPWCIKLAAGFGGQKVYFGHEGDVAVQNYKYQPDGEMDVSIAPIGRLRLPLPVPAQLTNVALAVAIALQHGVTDFEEPLRAACRSSIRFKLFKLGPLQVIDDSYNANPASMRAAIDALAEQPGARMRIAVLGEMLELGSEAQEHHRELGEYAALKGVTHLFARGPHASNLVAAATAADMPHAEAIESHQKIAEAVAAHARPGSALLVKGSRGMKMELVLEELRKTYAAETA